MRLWTALLEKRGKAVAPVDFTLPDDQGRSVTYDATFRAGSNSVLVWYRGHW